METYPVLKEITGGWAALAKRWAVHGKTKEEALAKFAETEQRRKEITAKPDMQEDSAEQKPGN